MGGALSKDEDLLQTDSCKVSQGLAGVARPPRQSIDVWLQLQGEDCISMSEVEPNYFSRRPMH